MPAGDIYQLAVRGRLHGQAVVNVLHFRSRGTTIPASDEASDLATDFWATVGVAWMDFRDTDYFVDSINVRAVRPNNALAHDEDLSPPANGNLAGEQALPPQSALVVSLRTPQAGRSHRGRIYLGGWTESRQDAGTWDATTIAKVDTLMQAIMTRYQVGSGTGAFDFVVWSRPYAAYTSYNPRTGVATNHPAYAGQDTAITGYLIRPTVFTQRKRALGVGS